MFKNMYFSHNGMSTECLKLDILEVVGLMFAWSMLGLER